MSQERLQGLADAFAAMARVHGRSARDIVAAMNLAGVTIDDLRPFAPDVFDAVERDVEALETMRGEVRSDDHWRPWA